MGDASPDPTLPMPSHRQDAIRLSMIVALAVLLGACASGPGGFTPEIKEQWRQRDAEAGTLPVGRIASIEKLAAQRQTYREAPPMQPAYIPGPAGVGAAIVASVYNAGRNTDVAFRHSILMRDGTTRVVELPYAFELNECVAFRTGLDGGVSSPIPALAGECDRQDTASR